MTSRSYKYFQLQKLYRANMKAVGVAYRTPPPKNGFKRVWKEFNHAIQGATIAFQEFNAAVAKIPGATNP